MGAEFSKGVCVADTRTRGCPEQAGVAGRPRAVGNKLAVHVLRLATEIAPCCTAGDAGSRPYVAEQVGLAPVPEARPSRWKLTPAAPPDLTGMMPLFSGVPFRISDRSLRSNGVSVEPPSDRSEESG